MSTVKPMQLISFDQNKSNSSSIQKLLLILKLLNGFHKPVKINTLPSSLLLENIEQEKAISSTEYYSTKTMASKLDQPSTHAQKDFGFGPNSSLILTIQPSNTW